MLRHAAPSVVLALAVSLAACSGDMATRPASTTSTRPSFDRAGYTEPGTHRQYGAPVKVGDGMARAYVVTDNKNAQAPLELGIALDEKALDGLPSDQMMYMYLLPLPQLAPAPYKLIELDWNPHGHVPPGVYTFPHFDFHFYAISLAERNAIDPSSPDYRAEANNLPTAGYVPPFYIPLAGPGQQPADAAVPFMGFHWSDVRAPELQGLLGNPSGYQQFTKTFIYGSWNGRFIFVEPMITRAYLLTHPDVTTDVPVPAKYAFTGYFPTSYKVTYDPQAKEYRVALTGLTYREAQ